MLHYAVVFFVIAIIAAVLGFGGIAGSAAGIAKILFVGFLILSVLSLIFGKKKKTAGRYKKSAKTRLCIFLDSECIDGRII